MTTSAMKKDERSASVVKEASLWRRRTLEASLLERIGRLADRTHSRPGLAGPSKNRSSNGFDWRNAGCGTTRPPRPWSSGCALASQPLSQSERGGHAMLDHIRLEGREAVEADRGIRGCVGACSLDHDLGA